MSASNDLRRVGCCFDHMPYVRNRCDFRLADAALEMVTSKWWRSIPVYEEPKPVSGEIPWR